VTESELESRLGRFLAKLPVESIARQAARVTGRDEAYITQLLETFRNEARATLAVVEAHLRTEGRMLEVGAGLCLFSLFLRREGYEITALEPAMGGYSLFDTLRSLIIELHPDVMLPMLTCPAGELNATQHGSFDLVFSNNVIEHIPDWQAAFLSMMGMLGEGGYMLHACPNYSLPYEPHYGVPVLRRFPSLSKRLFLSENADGEIWDSLNFISHRQVRRFAVQHDFTVVFTRGLIYQALARVQSDPLFRQRHKGFVASVADFLASTGMLKLLRYLPPAMSTPMVFVMQRRETN